MNISTSVRLATVPVLAILAAVALPARMASAQMITVPDNTFAAPSTSTYQNNTGLAASSVVPGTGNAWYYLGGLNQTGITPVGVENTAANGAEIGGVGSQDGYVNTGAFMGSAVLATIQANTTYTLTVNEAVRSNGYNETSGFTIALAFSPNAAGDTGLASSSDFASSLHVTLAQAQAAGGSGKFVPYTTSFTTGSTGSDIGENLFVVLGSDAVSTAQNPADFNDVLVAEQAAPEPSTYVLLALGAGMLVVMVARRRSTV